MVLMLRLTVALLATLLACGFGAHAWRQRSFGVACLALWMAALAFSAWVAVLMILPGVRLTPTDQLLINLVVTLAAPLLVGYVTYAVRGIRLHWAWFLPFGAQALASFVLGTRLNIWVNPVKLIPLQ